MPTIHCPSCKQSYDVEPDTIEKKVQCAVCNEKFVAQIEEAVLLLKNPAKQQSCFPQADQPPYKQTGYTSQTREQEQAGHVTLNQNKA